MPTLRYCRNSADGAIAMSERPTTPERRRGKARGESTKLPLSCYLYYFRHMAYRHGVYTAGGYVWPHILRAILANFLAPIEPWWKKLIAEYKPKNIRASDEPEDYQTDQFGPLKWTIMAFRMEPNSNETRDLTSTMHAKAIGSTSFTDTRTAANARPNIRSAASPLMSESSFGGTIQHDEVFESEFVVDSESESESESEPDAEVQTQQTAFVEKNATPFITNGDSISPSSNAPSDRVDRDQAVERRVNAAEIVEPGGVDVVHCNISFTRDGSMTTSTGIQTANQVSDRGYTIDESLLKSFMLTSTLPLTNSPKRLERFARRRNCGRNQHHGQVACKQRHIICHIAKTGKEGRCTRISRPPHPSLPRYA